MLLIVFRILSYTATAFSIVHIYVCIQTLRNNEKAQEIRRATFWHGENEKEYLLPPAEKSDTGYLITLRITVYGDRSFSELPPRYGLVPDRLPIPSPHLPHFYQKLQGNAHPWISAALSSPDTLSPIFLLEVP